MLELMKVSLNSPLPCPGGSVQRMEAEARQVQRQVRKAPVLRQEGFLRRARVQPPRSKDPVLRRVRGKRGSVQR